MLQFLGSDGARCEASSGKCPLGLHGRTACLVSRALKQCLVKVGQHADRQNAKSGCVF